ncbi:hypothetical protein D3C71_1137960 [compost metagenome]
MVACADVGHHGHLAAVKTQAFAQDAASCGFEHGCIHLGVQQHVAGALGAAAVATVDLAAVHVHAVGVGHAHAQALSGEQVGDEAGRGGLAVGAGDGHHWDAPIVAMGVELVHHGLTHVAGLAVAGCQVHAQAGGGVHFHKAAALLFERAQHGLGNHIHAADVQAHHLGGGHSACGNLGMHVIGHVGGGATRREVGIVAQDDALALGGHRVGRQVLHGQAGHGNVVEPDLGERGGMALAPAWVEVDLVDQLAHRVLAVAQHLGRLAACSGHQLVADHQQAEVMARQKALDHHGAVFGGVLVGFFELGAVGDVDRYTLALVAILRLDHHGQADLEGHFPAFVHALDRFSQRHGHASGMQQAFGQVLVLADGFGHGAGRIDLGRLDTALLGAPAKLHEAATREAAVGDAARHGGVHDGAGAGAQALVFVEFAQLGNHGVGIKITFALRCLDELLRILKGFAAHGLFAVFHDHLVHTRIGGGGGAREGDRATCLCLQCQGGSLQHMGQRDIAAPGFGVQRADGGKQGPQAGFEPGHLAHGALVFGAGHHGLDGHVAAPEVGATQGPGAGYIHGSLFQWSIRALRPCSGRGMRGQTTN